MVTALGSTVLVSTRKSKRFVVTVKPFAHPREFAVPLAVFLTAL